MSVISKKSFLNKADKQQSNWEQTTGQEAGGVLNKQDFIRQAQSAAQQRRQAQEQKAPQSERSGFDRTATPASIAGLGAPAPTSQRQKERYNQEIGQYGVGNIDLYNRPQYRNADGSISTVDSTSFNIQGKEVLLPSVWMKDGKASAAATETKFCSTSTTPGSSWVYSTQWMLRTATQKSCMMRRIITTPRSARRRWTKRWRTISCRA